MRFVWGALALVVAAAAVITVKPELVAADLMLQTPFAQIIAMRGWIVVGFLAMGLFFLIIGAIRFFLVRRGRIALTFSIAILLVAGLHAGTMYARGIDNREALSSDPAEGAVTVLEYNTMGGAVSSSDLAHTIAESDVNVVTLPETSTETGQEIVGELAQEGLEFQQFDTGTSGYEADYRSTVMLVSTSLGQYEQAALPSDSQGLKAVPTDGDGPAFIAVHTLSPGRDHMEAWASEIEQAYELCGSEDNAIIAGDFNSTADHQAALDAPKSCNDAVKQAGSGSLGTWPANVPPLLSSPIDRVLTTAPYEGSEAALVDLGGSDHRGVIVRLNPEGTAA